MLVHWRVGLALLPLLLAGLGAAGLCVVASGQASRAVDQIEAIDRKLAAAHEIEVASARYGLRAAQVLYEGRQQQDDLRTARLDMERAFLRLADEARDQAAAAPTAAETRTLLTDVENARRMLELYHSIDLSAARAFVLKRDGREEEASDIYRREVDFRLSNEFAALLDDAISSEQHRLESAREAWNAAAEGSLVSITILIAALVSASFASWYLLVRLQKRQPAELAARFEKRAEDLREANRQLRDTDQKRAQFLADVSHELRTPLTILRGEADVALMSANAPDAQRGALERIQDHAGEMAQLLDDLIAFARSDVEAQMLTLNRVLLDDVLTTAVEEGEMLAEPREVTIAVDLKDKGQWVDADMRRLKQALIIGLDNAINHSPPGSRIEVVLSRVGDSARVAIADRGPGLTQAEQDHVFDRFYRGASSGNSFGLGIGLAIAKGIIEQHHGSIALNNRSDGGAMLTIDLPLPQETGP